MSSDEVPGACIICQIPAKQVCSACRAVNYCGAEHQRQHWGKHKSECRPFRIAKDPDLGRYLLTTRDIRAGSKIFTESPIIVGPKWYLSESDEKAGIMPCVGCFKPCRLGIGDECPKCRWPACSTDCPGLQDNNKHGIECSILMLGSPGSINRNDIAALMDYYRADALLVLRCLLLQRHDPKRWQQLMDMQSHEEDRVGSELENDADKRVVSYLQKNFMQRLKGIEQRTKEKFLQVYNKAILHRICGIIETNYMCISMPNGVELSGVFYTGCMMEHDCIPNCYFQFDASEGFRINVTAGRAIAKGEHLKIMYSNMLWGTQLRLEHLGVTKHFQCKCERCRDPTECGTYFSALLCVGDVGKECGGVQLPKDPLDLKTDWACNKCPMIVSGEEVRYLLTQMTAEVEDLLASKPKIKQVEALIKKLLHFLHPNHYHMFSLKHFLIQLYGTEAGYHYEQLTDEQLAKKLSMCEQLNDICCRLDPHTIRLSIYVSIIYYEIHAVLVERGRRLSGGLVRREDAASQTANDEDSKSSHDSYRDALEYLRKASGFLEKELDNVAGTKLMETIAKAIADLETEQKQAIAE